MLCFLTFLLVLSLAQEPSPESDEAAAASANIKGEDREALEDPMETHFGKISKHRHVFTDCLN